MSLPIIRLCWKNARVGREEPSNISGITSLIASPRICWFVQSRQPGSHPRQRLGDEKIQRTSGGTSLIAMVKSSDLRELYHRAQFGPLEGPRDGRVLGQR
jgi:hypothetical protein